MRKVLLMIGAAALAASMPAFAEKDGKGGGGGHGGGKGHAAQSHGGGGNGGGKGHRVGGGKPGKAERHAFQGGGGKPHRAERQAFRGGGKPGKAERQALRGGGGKPDKAERQAFRAPNGERKAIRQAERELARVNDMRRDDRVDLRAFRDNSRRYAAAGADCPPGLARKGNGCLPPGQAKKTFALGQRVQPAWFGGYNVPREYSDFYYDTPETYYRYSDEGYIYRVDQQTDLISGLIPLLGGGFAVGQPLPAGYDVYNVPYQYRDEYYDTDESTYRYGDDAIYEVDPQSGIIESIVALLAGDLNVGQALPAGYDVYNVPMEYRDQYPDSDEAMYRYADGNIYEVDPQTQMIQAIVEMLV